MDNNELDVFLRGLKIEVDEASSGLSDGKPSEPEFYLNSFTKIVLERLEEVGEIENYELCYYQLKTGSGWIQINGYAVREEEETIDLFVTEIGSGVNANTVPHADLLKRFKNAIRFYKYSAKGAYKDTEPTSQVYAMMRDIADYAEIIRIVRVFILVSGIASSKEIAVETDNDIEFRPVLWDLERLCRCFSSAIPYSEIDIDLKAKFGSGLPALMYSPKDAVYDAVFTIFPGEYLAKLYDEYRARLLDLNVRSFLQARGKVNKGIRDTLKKNPENFLAFNNGITATALDIVIEDNGNNSSNIIALKGLQIVNGGQTVASLHRALLDSNSNLESVRVATKICRVDVDNTETLAPKISLFSNSQNKVNEADFTSNHPFHIEIQNLSKSVWAPGQRYRWYYERSRGQYQVARQTEGNTKARLKKFDSIYPKDKVISKTDLAKYINCWIRRPDVVSKGAQTNFVRFMNDFVVPKCHVGWLPSEKDYKEFIGKTILFRYANDVVKESFIKGYGANVVYYLVSYISLRVSNQFSFDQVWNIQEATPGLKAAVDEWYKLIYATIVETAGDRNVTQWCKKAECWDVIKRLQLDMPEELRKEIGKDLVTSPNGDHSEPSEALSEEETRNLIRVMELDSDAWFRIHQWGKDTGSLYPAQVAIALSLSSYATNNWSKKPTVKQARSGAKILDTVENNGGLEVIVDN